MGPPPATTRVVRWASAGNEGRCTVSWLPIDTFDVEHARKSVTETEWQRAAAYTRERDCVRSLASAWLARRLTADVLDVDPVEVPIHRRCTTCGEPHGRPVVEMAGVQGEQVEISATHSGRLVGVAVSTSGAAIGLDLEDLDARGGMAWSAVWRALGVDPPASHVADADQCAALAWTRAEAVLKATGHGLRAGVRSVETRSTLRGPVVVRWPWGSPEGRVSLFDLAPAPRCVATLAVIHGGREDLFLPSGADVHRRVR